VQSKLSQRQTGAIAIHGRRLRTGFLRDTD
jgi:hypothetical protein